MVGKAPWITPCAILLKDDDKQEATRINSSQLYLPARALALLQTAMRQMPETRHVTPRDALRCLDM
jgi:hypothetical protein